MLRGWQRGACHDGGRWDGLGRSPLRPPPSVSPPPRLHGHPRAPRSSRLELPGAASWPLGCSPRFVFHAPLCGRPDPPGQVRLPLAALTVFKFPETFGPRRTLSPLPLSPLFPNELLGLQALNAPSCQVRRLAPPRVPEALSLRVSAWTAFGQNCSFLVCLLTGSQAAGGQGQRPSRQAGWLTSTARQMRVGRLRATRMPRTRPLVTSLSLCDGFAKDGCCGPESGVACARPQSQ